MEGNGINPYVLIIVLNVAMKLDGLIDWPWMVVIWPVLLYCLLGVIGFAILWYRSVKKEFEEAKKGDE